MLLSIFTLYSWCFVYIFINKMFATLFVVCILTIGMKKRSRCCSIHHRKTNMYHHWHRRRFSRRTVTSEGLRKLPAAARNGAGQPNWFFSHKKCGKDLASWICSVNGCGLVVPCQQNIWLLTWLVWLMPLDLQIPSSSWLPSLKSHKQSQLHGFTIDPSYHHVLEAGGGSTAPAPWPKKKAGSLDQNWENYSVL